MADEATPLRIGGLYRVLPDAVFFTVEGDIPERAYGPKSEFSYPSDPMFIEAEVFILSDCTFVNQNTNEPIEWVSWRPLEGPPLYIDPKYLAYEGELEAMRA